MGTVELLGKPIKLRGVTCDGLTSPPVGVEIILLHATETGISFNSYSQSAPRLHTGNPSVSIVKL